MVLKGSGVFQKAPDLASKTGLVILLGVAVIVAGVVLSTLAGFGRDRTLQKSTAATGTSGSFLIGLIMAVAAGILSVGLALGFVYTQAPIIKAVTDRGGTELSGGMAVWAIGLLGGAAANLAYPAWLMTKNRSWGVLFTSGRDAGLAVVLGIQFIIAVTLLLGEGMLLLARRGPPWASASNKPCNCWATRAWASSVASGAASAANRCNS